MKLYIKLTSYNHTIWIMGKRRCKCSKKDYVGHSKDNTLTIQLGVKHFYSNTFYTVCTSPGRERQMNRGGCGQPIK